MASKAEEIMQFLFTAIDAAVGVTAYRSRNVPVGKTDAPWVNLFWSKDEIEGSTFGNRCIRVLRVHTVVGARGAVPDSLADSARTAVHAAVMADQTCGGKSATIEEMALTCQQVSADDDAALLERVYDVKYETDRDDDTAA